MHMLKSLFVFFVLGILISVPALAQHKKKSNSAHSTTPKQVVPLLKGSLGHLPGGFYSTDSLVRMLNSGLFATDQFAHNYPVIHFEFGYQSTDTSYNDTTGMSQLVNNYISYTFNSPRLDTLWLPRITQNLAIGDTLYFDQIIAEDTLRHIKYGVNPLKFGVR